MKRFACLAIAGCSFVPGQLPASSSDAADASDADLANTAADTAPVARVCDPQPDLLVCFSFDAPTFGTTMANEGTASVTAQLTAVNRSALGAGGAAEVTTASRIYIPPDAALVGVRTLEMWARIDVAPATTGARVGLIDADSTPSAMSFFYYKQSAGFQIRYEIGVQLFLDQTITLGSWVYLAQVRDSGTLTAYVNGTSIGTSTGCNPGTAAPYGLIVGANNLQGGNKDAELTGATNALRIWTTPRSPTQICEAAGLTLCP